MKSGKPFSREEIIRELISEAAGEVMVELGVNDAKRLLSGEQAGDNDGTGSGGKKKERNSGIK